jgi:exodeoxyribonuclease V alpha subunit
MSIHKSQGSEFNEVLMILDSVDSPHLSKELIYTGITRAKSKLTLWHEPSVTALSASRKTQRTSSIKNILQAH